MNTPTKSLHWNSSASREMHTVNLPKWRGVRHGLRLVMVGEVLLLALGGLCAVLLSPWSSDIAAYLRLSDEDVLVLASGLAGCGALLGYLLVLIGQWRCLVHAPQGHGAKELQFASLLCSLAAPFCLVAGRYLGGPAVFTALTDLNVLVTGVPPLVAGLFLVLLAMLLLSGFTRAIGGCLRSQRTNRWTGYYFWFSAFLLGGSAGVLMEVRRGSGQEALPVLAIGWVLCLVWHLVLVRGTARRVAQALRGRSSRRVPAVQPQSVAPEQGQVVLQAAAYLHRAS